MIELTDHMPATLSTDSILGSLAERARPPDPMISVLVSPLVFLTALLSPITMAFSLAANICPLAAYAVQYYGRLF